MVQTATDVTELVDRSRELSALAAALDDVVVKRQGRLVLVRGEAGAGKTALVGRFCSERAVRVLHGACDPLFTPRPLAPFLDISRDAGGEVARVTAGNAQPYDVADALLRRLEAPQAQLVVVEDVHWADEATLDVLRILARRIAAVPALVVLTYRDDELDRRHPLRSLLGELAPARRSLRIDVGPLSPAAVAELAKPHGVDADDLHRKSGGNAFFVTEALAAGDVRIPETVRDAVLARAARLGPAARRLLETVAVLPPHAEAWLLDALVPGPAGGVEECLASGMLRAEPGRVLFRHELGGWRSRSRCLLTSASRSTGGRSPRSPCRPTGSRTSPGSLTMRRRRGTARRCSASRRPPPSAPPRSAPTARQPTSTRAPCASGPGFPGWRRPGCSSAWGAPAT